MQASRQAMEEPQVRGERRSKEGRETYLEEPKLMMNQNTILSLFVYLSVREVVGLNLFPSMPFPRIFSCFYMNTKCRRRRKTPEWA